MQDISNDPTFRRVKSDHVSADIAASAVDLASFDIMKKPLIPTQIVNAVMPSIPSMPNSVLNTSTDDLSSFIDVPMKGDTANHYSTALHDATENNATALT